MEKRTPYVGETVLYTPDANDTVAKLNDSFDPMPALVTKVHGPDMVNLTIFPDNRPPQLRQSVSSMELNPDVSNFSYLPAPMLVAAPDENTGE